MAWNVSFFSGWFIYWWKKLSLTFTLFCEVCSMCFTTNAPWLFFSRKDGKNSIVKNAARREFKEQRQEEGALVKIAYIPYALHFCVSAWCYCYFYPNWNVDTRKFSSPFSSFASFYNSEKKQKLLLGGEASKEVLWFYTVEMFGSTPQDGKPKQLLE